MDTPAPTGPPSPMRHRSFYMRGDVADRLAAAVDDLHYSARRPRHEVLAALVDVVLDHRSEIEARLARQDGTT
jgi:hypothetical protein